MLYPYVLHSSFHLIFHFSLWIYRGYIGLFRIYEGVYSTLKQRVRETNGIRRRFPSKISSKQAARQSTIPRAPQTPTLGPEPQNSILWTLAWLGSSLGSAWGTARFQQGLPSQANKRRYKAGCLTRVPPKAIKWHWEALWYKLQRMLQEDDYNGSFLRSCNAPYLTLKNP